jgi:hypothetical protein
VCAGIFTGDGSPGKVWLIVIALANEFGPGESFDIKRFWPEDPKQLPKELEWWNGRRGRNEGEADWVFEDARWIGV